MGKVFDHISDEFKTWIDAQHLFFVATAPLSAEGHINLSPKGGNAFRVLSATQVAYLDMTGSGNETSAHLHENGRITFMFCAFEGAPRILRLQGTGRTVLPSDDDWATVSAGFDVSQLGVRQIIVADITRVSTACGFSVPMMDFVEDRDTLTRWAEAKGADGVAQYQQEKNVTSIDGLPTPFGLSQTT